MAASANSSETSRQTPAHSTPPNSAPPAEGVRLHWPDLPAPLRAQIERLVGSRVIDAATQRGGFSPGLAARLRLQNGQRVFAKAISPQQNPSAPRMHRREAAIVAAMPPHAPVPRLLDTYDEGPDGWIVLVYEDIEGRNPATPWQPLELDRVLVAASELATTLTFAPNQTVSNVFDQLVPTAGDRLARGISGWQKLQADPALCKELDDWSARHLNQLADLETHAPAAAAGHTLLHFDLRADNVLLTADRVWFVDWPHAALGAAWIDVMLMAPSVTMQGGPPPAELLARQPHAQTADPAAITAGITAMAGFFTYQALLPPPPGLPTLRAFQAAQGTVARAWLAQRTGWK
ncbi:MAG: aminoglycoside phosphotransferase family protein [Litorilinea sp.]